MKTGSRLLLALCLVLVVVLLLLLNRPTRPKTSVNMGHDSEPALDSTNPPALSPERQAKKYGFDALTEAEREQLRDKLTTEFKPALERWYNAYAGHVPFRPDALSAEDFRDKLGRGDYYRCYVFVSNGMTIGMEERNGVAKVAYLNTPQTKQLMDLPKGAPPNINAPVTTEDVTRMVKEDSGQDFQPSDIRMVPTAVSSSMQGGAHFMIGGDPSNPVTWKYTLTFGPDKMLTYYMKGNAP